jgi:nucleoside-diphosphate-sugar epimerase
MSRPLILITGATGFIGAHVVAQTLSAGYHVRLSVRKEAQISSLRRLFSSHEASLDFVIVTDFTRPDAFGQALKGVTYVFHLASPMPGTGDDFQNDYVKPAVEGTTALLEAAKKTSTIKRIIIVSSLLALIPPEAMATGNITAKGTYHLAPTPLTHRLPSPPLLHTNSPQRAAKSPSTCKPPSPATPAQQAD